MNCIQLHPPLLPLHSVLKHQQHLRQTKLLCLTSSNLGRIVPQNLHFPSPSPVRTKALPHPLVIAAASSPPKSIDTSVFLQTSALLLFVYFTANFIVPELITKYFGFDKLKDQKVDDVNATEDK